MSNWPVLFRETRNSVRAAEPWTEGVRRAVAVAGDNPQLFDVSGYWSQVASHDFRSAWGSIERWAKEGLESFKNQNNRTLPEAESWEVVLLDLGDCPELFRFYSPGGQSLMVEQKVRDLLLGEDLFECTQLEGCFADPEDSQFLFGRGNTTERVYHNVRELGDDVLSWNARAADSWYQGNNGYFLWLLLGSFALLAPLTDREYCKSVLQGRQRVYLSSGFESLFSYLATVTPEGIRFETVPEEKGAC